MNRDTAVEWLFDKLLEETPEGDLVWKLKEDIISILDEAKIIQKNQHNDTWDVAHQAGRLEGKGIAEENWQTFESHWKEITE